VDVPGTWLMSCVVSYRQKGKKKNNNNNNNRKVLISSNADRLMVKHG
jgi:hypothetical protein